MIDPDRLYTRGEYRWPSGIDRAAAVFALTPEEVTARSGLRFESGIDDLDYFRAVGLRLPSGRHAVLLWYERAPVLGLSLQVDAADDPQAAREEVMSMLGLVPDELSWFPDSNAPAG